MSPTSMTQQQPETLQAEPNGEAEVAEPRAELRRGQANPPVPADAQQTAVWLMQDEQRTVAAVIEVHDADGRLLGRLGWLDLADEPHPATLRARATELNLRMVAGGTVRGMRPANVACELDPELLAVAVSVDDLFDNDGYFLGRGAGFQPAADEAETERRRQVCNEHLRAAREVVLDDRWEALWGIACDRRAVVCRATKNPKVHRLAFDEERAAMDRIDKLERETLEREAAGDWHADWDDLVIAAFFPEEV